MPEKKKINFKIITHEKIVYENEVDAIYAHGVQGMFGVLPDHVPFMSTLVVGVTKIENEGKIDYITTMGGIFQLKDNQAVILTDVAENGIDIDIERAEKAKERAFERLNNPAEDIDVPRAEMALAKALARLKATVNKF